MFLSSVFLIAAGVGATVPLVLHLIQSSRTVQMPFPTIRFLQLADKKSSRRIKMEHWLLWLIRTFIMLMLGCAFAMPMLRTRRLGWLGEAPRDVAIVIDASYSMAYNTGQQTVWQKAIDTAGDIVRGLGENDRFCIYVAREHPEPVVAELIGDKDEGVSQLKGLEMGYTSSRLAPAVVAVNEVLNKEHRRREREVYIITDNQSLPWDSFGREGMAAEGEGAGNVPGKKTVRSLWDPTRIDKYTTVFVVLLGVAVPENVGVGEVDLQPPFVLKGATAKVTARLGHSGVSRSTTMTLYVDDEETGRRSTVVGAPDSGELSFLIPPLRPGTHAARIETPSDSLSVDNTFHFLIHVKDELPTLCIGTEDDTFFIRAALNASVGGTSGVEAKWVTPDAAVEEQFHAYACIFLCNALPVPGQALTALDQYVKTGGLMVVFPGRNAVVADYAIWQCMPGVPTAASEVPFSKRKRLLSWDKPQHPILRPLRSGFATPVVTVRQNLVWEELAQDAEQLISSGAGDPFLVERPYGRGRVLMFAVAADRSWSDFPLSPFYLPIVHQLIEYGVGVGAFTPYLWTTESLPLDEYLPEASRDATIKDPTGKNVSVRSAILDGTTVLHAENLMVPGIYTLTEPGRAHEEPALAINVPREESNLTPLTISDIPGILRVSNLYIAHTREDLLRLLEDHRIGRTFGEHILWAVLILCIVEFCYANFLLRAAPKLTEQLTIEASGKVRGHASIVDGAAERKAEA